MTLLNVKKTFIIFIHWKCLVHSEFIPRGHTANNEVNFGVLSACGMFSVISARAVGKTVFTVIPRQLLRSRCPFSLHLSVKTRENHLNLLSRLSRLLCLTSRKRLRHFQTTIEIRDNTIYQLRFTPKTHSKKLLLKVYERGTQKYRIYFLKDISSQIFNKTTLSVSNTRYYN